MAFMVERSLGFEPVLIAVAVLAAGTLTGQVGVAWYFPFRPSQAAIASLARGLEDGRLKVFETGPENFGSGAMPPGRTLSYLLTVSALVLAALPSAYMALSPAPRNAGCIPEVVGPGRTVRIFADEEVPCIDGYWAGQAHVIVVDAERADAGDLAWAAYSRGEPLPKSIQTKSTPGSHQGVHPWVELDIPNDPALGDRSYRVDAMIAVEHPKWSGPVAFDTIQTVVHKAQTLALASRARAEAQYYLSWAGIIGAAVLVLCGELLCHLGNPRMRDLPLPKLDPDPEPEPTNRSPSRRTRPSDN